MSVEHQMSIIMCNVPQVNKDLQLDIREQGRGIKGGKGQEKWNYSWKGLIDFYKPIHIH